MSQDELRYLGEAFRSVREETGLSVSQLAAATGVDQTRLLALEEGRLNADLDLLILLADGMRTRLSTIFLRIEELERGKD
jgi:transcriptional regulator with XRE-family HTH domain